MTGLTGDAAAAANRPATRRERLRAGTEVEIRRHARTLLVEHGRDAVTLRAIARELGITAPALYRYYDSREDLLRQLCDDICGELAAELTRELETLGDDYMAKIFAVCRGFRGWALAHPQEFTLVFATPPAEIADTPRSTTERRPDQDQFATVFLGIIGPLMAEGVSAHLDSSGAADRPDFDLTPEQQALTSAFAAKGIEVPAEALQQDAVYSLLHWWVHIYGHVALEVFGRFPFDLTHADRLFDMLLSELTRHLQMT